MQLQQYEKKLIYLSCRYALVVGGLYARGAINQIAGTVNFNINELLELIDSIDPLMSDQIRTTFDIETIYDDMEAE